MLAAETPHGHRADFATVADYERSWMWRNSRIRYGIAGAPWACFICGSPEIELHHRSYERCGSERPEELVALCADHHRMVETLVGGRWASRWNAHLLLVRRLAARRDRTPRRLTAWDARTLKEAS